MDLAARAAQASPEVRAATIAELERLRRNLKVMRSADAAAEAHLRLAERELGEFLDEPQTRRRAPAAARPRRRGGRSAERAGRAARPVARRRRGARRRRDAVALWDTRWRVVPTETAPGAASTDPPTARARRAGAGLRRRACAALLVARAARRAPSRCSRWAVAALPAVPVLTGRLLPLLAFQGPVLVLVVGAVAGRWSVRA